MNHCANIGKKALQLPNFHSNDRTQPNIEKEMTDIHGS